MKVEDFSIVKDNEWIQKEFSYEKDCGSIQMEIVSCGYHEPTWLIFRAKGHEFPKPIKESNKKVWNTTYWAKQIGNEMIEALWIVTEGLKLKGEERKRFIKEQYVEKYGEDWSRPFHDLVGDISNEFQENW